MNKDKRIISNLVEISTRRVSAVALHRFAFPGLFLAPIAGLFSAVTATIDSDFMFRRICYLDDCIPVANAYTLPGTQQLKLGRKRAWMHIAVGGPSGAAAHCFR